MDTNNTVVRLCGKMVIETKGDKELILFPDLPKWAIVNKGGSKFLEYVSEHSLEEIRNTTNQLDYQFVLDALNAGLLIENDPIKYKIENLDEKIFPLISVWLNITSSCNLQCRHCFLGKRNKV